MKAKELMNKEVVTVEAETPIVEVARLLVEHKVSGLPVVSKRGILKGVVSENNLINKIVKPEEPGMKSYILHGVFHSDEVMKYKEAMNNWKAEKAGDIMSAPAIAVDVEDDIEKAGQLILDNRIKRVFVTEEEGFLVGVISRSDFVKLFLERAQEE